MTAHSKNPLAAPVQGGGKGTSKSTRPYRIIVLLGAPGSGKSSLTEELVDAQLAAGRDVRVLDRVGNWPGIGEWPAKDDDPRSPEDIAEEWAKELMKSRPRGGSHKPLTIVLEDADAYLTKPPRPVWKTLFAVFRHYRLDIVINGRRTQDLPLLIFSSATNVYLFRHFTPPSYIRSEYGPDVANAIPEEPFRYVLFDAETRELHEGKTKARAVVTSSDGDQGAGGSGGGSWWS